MSKSEERRLHLIQEHWDKELQGWRLFRFEIERRWSLFYPGFDERDFVYEMEHVNTSGSHRTDCAVGFIKQYFNSEHRGHFEENVVGYADGLVFRARQRLRSKYHFSLTVAPPGGYSLVTGHPQMQSSRLSLTPDSLAAGIKIASAMNYAVTLSTPMAGASQRTFHFLAMPRVLRFGGRSFRLYESLEGAPGTLLSDCGDGKIELLHYPAFCVRMNGVSRAIAPLVWRLAEQYAALICFNLVVLPGTDIERTTVFFFPRPFQPEWEGPEKHKHTNGGKGWSFGAFEMGGFFVQGDKGIYDALVHDELCDFLREVSIFQSSNERERITKLLLDLASSPDAKAKLRSFFP